MKRICSVCSSEYETYPCKLKKGWKLFCSTVCRSLAKGTKVKRICEVCKKEFIVKRMAIVNSGAKYCSHDCMNKASKGRKKPSIQGSNHINWKNGASRQLYPLKFNDELKENIRKRDNYNCQVCGLQDEEHILVYGYSLTVHHIDYNKDNCIDNNLVSLCNQCHRRTNYNRAYWTDYFQSKLLLLIRRSM
jgi:hypothetical protein